MATSEQMELHKALRESQSKYTYFLLASVGATIGFAITQTKTSTLSVWQIPLGIAVLFWVLSFYYGCRYITYTNLAFYADAEKLRIQSGHHPEVGRDKFIVLAAASGVQKAFEINSNKASNLMLRQFRTFIIGSIAFVFWHIAGMLSRTFTEQELFELIRSVVS